MKNLVLAILIASITFSCTGQTKKNQINQLQLTDFLIKYEVPDSEKFTIDMTCALLIQVSDQEADSLENAGGDEYSEFADDENNASMTAFETLEKLNILTKNTDKRYIECTWVNQSEKIIIDTRTKDRNLVGHYIFFKENRKPIIIDCALITEDIINNYFLR